MNVQVVRIDDYLSRLDRVGSKLEVHMLLGTRGARYVHGGRRLKKRCMFDILLSYEVVNI